MTFWQDVKRLPLVDTYVLEDVCLGQQWTTSAMLFCELCFFQMRTSSNMGNKMTNGNKRKPRKEGHADILTYWLAYLLGVRLVHCLCWQEEQRQPHKNSEQCMITPSSSSTKGIAQHSLTGQAMDAATTPHSQTGNAESYKEASGLADLQVSWLWSDSHQSPRCRVNKNRHRTMLRSSSRPLQNRFHNSSFRLICTKIISTGYHENVPQTLNLSSWNIQYNMEQIFISLIYTDILGWGALSKVPLTHFLFFIFFGPG